MDLLSLGHLDPTTITICSWACGVEEWRGKLPQALMLFPQDMLPIGTFPTFPNGWNGKQKSTDGVHRLRVDFKVRRGLGGAFLAVGTFRAQSLSCGWGDARHF